MYLGAECGEGSFGSVQNPVHPYHQRRCSQRFRCPVVGKDKLTPADQGGNHVPVHLQMVPEFLESLCDYALPGWCLQKGNPQLREIRQNHFVPAAVWGRWTESGCKQWMYYRFGDQFGVPCRTPDGMPTQILTIRGRFLGLLIGEMSSKNLGISLQGTHTHAVWRWVLTL